MAASLSCAELGTAQHQLVVVVVVVFVIGFVVHIILAVLVVTVVIDVFVVVVVIVVGPRNLNLRSVKTRSAIAEILLFLLLSV